MTARTMLPALAAAAALSGCLSSGGSRETRLWTVECRDALVAEDPRRADETVPPKTVRLGAVSVSAPWDSDNIVVRRADGSVAFDAYNEFAASPSTMLRAPVMAQLSSDGRFGRVVAPSSVASADAAVEVLVRDLSLDCSEAGKRTARASVSVDVVKTGRGARTVALSGDGDSTADAAGGNYSAAFSTAFNEALKAALSTLK